MSTRTARVGLVLAVTGFVLAVASPAIATNGPSKVDYRDLRNADAEVFMMVRATPDQVAGVRREIEASKLVTRFAFLDRADAYREFSRIFRDDPDLVANVGADSLPMSFRVDLRDSRDRSPFKTRFENLAGVDTVKLHQATHERAAAETRGTAAKARCGDDAPVEVFLKVGATTADEDAVEAALRATPQVTAVRKISRDEAKRVFDCLFADNPDLRKNVDAASLPVSFRVEARDGTNLRKLAQTLEALPGVDHVEVD